MTKLSVNLNKIALLRNSRGRDYPNVVNFAKRFIVLGADGITVHPRQDERHTTKQDVYDLAEIMPQDGTIEFNIEGYPSEDFLELVEAVKPAQCTLVPDKPGQLTSDHGWDVITHAAELEKICTRLKQSGIRTALFIDPDLEQINAVPTTGADRIELYTEHFAKAYQQPNEEAVLSTYKAAAKQAIALGIELNAGHDLDLNNLKTFLSIGNIKEVSIGHALTIECIEQGLEKVTEQYISICHGYPLI